MTLNDIFLRLSDIDHKAQALLADAGSECDDWIGCEVRTDSSDPEDRFLQKSLEALLAQFEDIHEQLDYLKTPTHGEYQLERLPSGRYGYVDEDSTIHMFSCGSSIEAKIMDSHGRPRWIKSRIEHDGNDYFLWLHDSVPLDGLIVRERR